MAKKDKEVTKDTMLLDQSIPDGTKRREPGPAEKARRKANAQRDGRTNLGVGKPSTVVVD